jgi:hypothetical protein
MTAATAGLLGLADSGDELFVLTAQAAATGTPQHLRPGPRLSAFAVRHAVRVPIPWSVLALAGVLFVGLDLWRQRRDRPLPGASGPFGVFARVLGSWAQDQPAAEGLWSRVVFLVLMISCAPMLVAFVLGVGR